METSKKLIVGSYFIILLILFIGLSSLYSMNKFYENSQVNAEVDELIKQLNHPMQELLLLTHTNNLDDYNQIKSGIEIIRTGFDVLHQKVDPILHKFEESDRFEDNVNEFTRSSNNLMRIQKEFLVEKKEFADKTILERDLRREIRGLISELEDIELITDSWNMEYKSKEALYQYRDEKHLEEWLEAINRVRGDVKEFDFREEKNILLDKIDSYYLMASDFGDLAIKQEMIKKEKHLGIEELHKIVDKIEESERSISNKMDSQSSSLARNIFLMIIIITGIGVILLIISHTYILRHISKTHKIRKYGKKVRKK